MSKLKLSILNLKAFRGANTIKINTFAINFCRSPVLLYYQYPRLRYHFSVKYASKAALLLSVFIHSSDFCAVSEPIHQNAHLHNQKRPISLLMKIFMYHHCPHLRYRFPHKQISKSALTLSVPRKTKFRAFHFSHFFLRGGHTHGFALWDLVCTGFTASI